MRGDTEPLGLDSGTELDRVAGLGAAMPASGAADSLPLPSGCP